MKHKLVYLFLLFTTFAFSQQEASVWYFGINAGIKFNTNGTITALTDGQINTSEGCATIADGNGNLLFYTDGITVWNKNHQVMQNGTGLMGNWSSSQSATIVPLPGSSTLFYVFTLDAEAQVNGFRYSIIDVSLNGGLGGVTANKNVLVYAPSNEKLSIVKHANNNDYWVVTHGWNNNSFYSYLLTSSGLSATAITSNVGLTTTGSTNNAWGCMKIAPDGSKLATCNSLSDFELFDFNNTTGLVSNPIILNNIGFNYGVEFSPDSEVLYLSVSVTNTDRRILQYDLTSGNIINSAQIIYNSNIVPGALQLGPDGKIYVAEVFETKLGVINNPNTIGSGCNLQMGAIDLAGKSCTSGLPPFVSSFFFSPTIQLDNACVGQSASFQVQTSQIITNAAWDFGDGNTSNAIQPTHTYAVAGTYTVTVTATSSLGTSTKTRNIVISAVPIVTQPQNLKICDTDNNGLYAFDLTAQNVTILNGQNPGLHTIKYFANATDYNNNIAIATPTNYTNAVAYQQQTIIAEVSNNANGDCKATTFFTITVFDLPKPNVSANIPNLTSCDNISVGTDADGKVIFDLTQRATAILNGQSTTQFAISYYRDATLTNQILTPANYSNTNPTETIYVKVVNNNNTSCSATTSFVIKVFSLPVITSIVDLKQCDDNIDGFSVFNLTEANSKISTNYQNETFTYFRTLTAAQNNTNAIATPTTYTNQIASNDVIYVRVTNANGCYSISQLNLIVSTTQVPLSFNRTFTVCDDAIQGTNTDGISVFDFSSVTPQIQNIFPAGQQLIIAYYRNLADALSEQNAITNTSNYRNIGYPNTQNIYIRVDSQLNNDCLGLGQYITLNVETIPIVQPQTYNHCDDDQDGQYAFDTTNLQVQLLHGLTNVTVAYFDQNNNPLPSPLPNPFVTNTQTLRAMVTNITTTACSYNTTIQFTVDDLPEAFPIPVNLTAVCDDEVNPAQQDGQFAFNTTTFQTTILGGQIGMIVKYYDQNNNPLPSPLPNPFVTSTQIVRVEVNNPLNPSCNASNTISFVVKPVPMISLIGNELVCNEQTITKTIDAGILDTTPQNSYTYIWKKDGVVIPNETSYSLNVNQQGTYTVEVLNTQGCSRVRTITVTASDIATIQNVQITELTDNNSIVVTVTGQGNYMYSLDNSNYQTSNMFSNIEPGIYIVYVKDLNGCGIAQEEVSVLGIPKFFTPNGDGYNDYWNIKGVNAKLPENTKIQIFDRYGKFIKQISSLEKGWDGKFNGQSLPATDYWYYITFGDGRIVKGHFALKR